MRFNNEFWIRIWSCTFFFFFFSFLFFFFFFLNLVLDLIKTFYVNLIPLYGFNWLVTRIIFVSSGQCKGLDMCLNFICLNLLTKTNYQHYHTWVLTWKKTYRSQSIRHGCQRHANCTSTERKSNFSINTFLKK